MSTDNVTPIRPGVPDTAAPLKAPKTRGRRKGAPRPVTVKDVLAVVDKQQSLLLNVEHVVRCIKSYTEDHCDEIAGAVELIEMELERITEALEPGMIKLAIERRRDSD